MNELLKEAETVIKEEAVALAIKTYLNIRRREKLAALIGNYHMAQTLEDLEAMR